MFLPCVSGPVAVQATASPARLRPLWQASSGGGPPIVAAGMVWTIGQDGTLYGLNPTTGAVEQHRSVGVMANHFPTPSVGGGLFLVPTANRVVAFTTTSSQSAAGTTTTTTAPTPTTRTTTPPPAPSNGFPAWTIVVIVLGVLAAVGSGGWWLLRRRKLRPPNR